MHSNFQSHNPSIDLHRNLLVLGIVFFSFFLTFFIQPFDKPDEATHFYKAISVSRGNFICQVKNNQPTNYIPVQVIEYVQKYSHSENIPINSTSVIHMNNESLVSETKSCVLPFFYYLLPAIIISLLLQLHTPMAVVFFIGRLVNVVFALSLLFISLKGISARLQFISLYVFALPMTLFQISSYSKDVYHLAFGVFLINRLIFFISEKKHQIGEVVLFLASMIAFVLTRPQYFWFMLLILLIPFTSPKKNQVGKLALRKFLITVVAVVIGGAILGFLVHQDVYLSPYNADKSLSYYQLINPQKQLQFVVAHLGKFVGTIVDSFVEFAAFYLKGAIGIFGALDKPLPNFIYLFYLFYGLIVTRIVVASEKMRQLASGLLVFLLVFFLTIINLFLAMYLYGSPVGARLVYGIQGRYFLLLIPLIMMITAIMISHIRELRVRRSREQ